MTLCINPRCPHPNNPDDELFCQACGSELLLAGRYRVISLLSDKGGFGKTYTVTHNGNTKVLKILTHQDPEALRLFEREYQVLNQLNHPGIPQGEEYFTFFPHNAYNPLHCIIMEYITGMNLEEYQEKRGKRPIDRKLALEWLSQVASILDAIHNQEFFHRDIKPSNIILKPDGQLVLIDFGGARQITTTVRAGKPNTLIYTPGYAPPEQENGFSNPQSDFFALGRTFVYLLTGKHPTEADIYDPNIHELNWRKFAPHVDSQLADLIDKLIERSASNRPTNTQEILQALEQIQNQLYSPGHPSSSKLTFSFEVVTVNSTGKKTNRERRQAEYFREDLGNGVFLDMVSIPGGSFIMGSPASEEEHLNNEGPQHRPTIAEFSMGKYPITQVQWKAVAALPQIEHSLESDPSYFQGDNLPVEQVSWHEAVELCKRLSRKTGRNYRLPSEAQWEYACRAGTRTPFHFSETITTKLANYDGNYPYANAPKGEDREKTTEVGSFPANAFGLYDLHGNVWEWCADSWHENYRGVPSDGRVWESSGDNSYRLVRGGSWFNYARYCRSAYRGRRDPGFRNWDVGVRVVAISLVWT